MGKNRSNNIDNYVVRNVYKEIIVRKEKAGKDTTVLRKRLEKLHGKKWKNIILKSVKTR
jgi:hypothetical protein